MAGASFDPYNLIGNIGTRAAETRRQAGSLGDIAKKGTIGRLLGQQKATAARQLETQKGKQSLRTEAAKFGFLPTNLFPDYSPGTENRLMNMRTAQDFGSLAEGLLKAAQGGVRVNPFAGGSRTIQQLLGGKFGVDVGLPTGTQTELAKPSGTSTVQRRGVATSPKGGMETTVRTDKTDIRQTPKESVVNQLRKQGQISQHDNSIKYKTPDGKAEGDLVILTNGQALIIDDDGKMHRLVGKP